MQWLNAWRDFLWPIRWHLLVIAVLIVLTFVNSLGSAVQGS
jgi:hypothetical protein